MIFHYFLLNYRTVNKINNIKDDRMKRNYLILALLFSILFWGVSASAFAQTQVKKDTVVKKADMKKDAMKKDMMKKGDVKKTEMKKVETTTKTEMKKGDMKKGEMNKEVTTKKTEMKNGDVKKDETKKVVTNKKTEMKKDMKDVKTAIKDKVVGKTADGKDIYEGPRGGKYTVSESGKKVYIKKDTKEVK
jgi:colicin import membrane protein